MPQKNTKTLLNLLFAIPHFCVFQCTQTTSIKTKYSTFINQVPEDIKLKFSKMHNLIPSEEVRDLSQQLFKCTKFDHNGLSGGNNSIDALRCKVKDEYFFIPPICR